jgi:hypothetical protein
VDAKSLVGNKYSFAPPRRLGMTLHAVAILILAAITGFGFWKLLQTSIGPLFVIDLLLSLFSTSLIPLFIYRLYALWGAYYVIERDGVHLHWGLRAEDIPMKSIQWVYTSTEVQQLTGRRPPLPWMRLPGALLGVRHLISSPPLEYLASSTAHLVLISTPERIYAVSPNDPKAFQLVYQRFNELGSLVPIPARSVYPSFLIEEVWRNRPARYILAVDLLLNILLVGWVSLVIPTRTEVILGIFAEEPSPSVHLLLLPIINGLFFLFSLLLGLFFYRRSSLTASAQGTRVWSLLVPGKVLAFVLWGSNILASLLFFGAMLFIVSFE